MAEYHGIWRNITEYGGISRNMAAIFKIENGNAGTGECGNCRLINFS
jgi:hypothetical protein